MIQIRSRVEAMLPLSPRRAPLFYSVYHTPFSWILQVFLSHGGPPERFAALRERTGRLPMTCSADFLRLGLV